MEISKAQCALCKDIITSEFGYARCECGTIAVDDGRYLSIDLGYVIEIKE